MSDGFAVVTVSWLHRIGERTQMACTVSTAGRTAAGVVKYAVDLFRTTSGFCGVGGFRPTAA